MAVGVAGKHAGPVVLRRVAGDGDSGRGRHVECDPLPVGHRELAQVVVGVAGERSGPVVRRRVAGDGDSGRGRHVECVPLPVGHRELAQVARTGLRPVEPPKNRRSRLPAAVIYRRPAIWELDHAGALVLAGECDCPGCATGHRCNNSDVSWVRAAT